MDQPDEENQGVLQSEEAIPNVPMSLENQLLLVPKFLPPITPSSLISRPRLTTLLNESLKYPLTLVSAAAGFGKTTLLASWSQSLPANSPRVAWVSLDEADNNPRLFWTYVLIALKMQQPERFTTLLMQLQSAQELPINYILIVLINLLAEGEDHFLLILDDYQVITEQQVHASLTYLIEHLPTQLRIILATRADPPLPFALFRSRKQILEVRTDQLCCTVEETRALFHEVMGIQLSDETVRAVTVRMEGWLMGLQLLGLSFPEQTDPLRLLQEISREQRYILDYLTEVVLKRQPQEVQTFLLCTSILEQLNATLCDAVTEQHSSQLMLQYLEKANLFVVSLDSKRQWYRYHMLFAEALRYQLERMLPNLVPLLHYRASIWYAKHDQTTQAILHAFKAHEWQWAADLIEQKSFQVYKFTWGANEHELLLLREWLEQLPLEVMGSRLLLCMTSVRLLIQVASLTALTAWLEVAEAVLTASLTELAQEDASSSMLDPKARQELYNKLGEVLVDRAFIKSYDKHGEVALPLCQQALRLVSTDNYYAHIIMAWAQLYAHYYSTNDTEAAIQSGLQAISLTEESGLSAMTITALCAAARHIKETGQLHEAQRLIQQATLLGTKPGGSLSPEAGHPAIWQAELLREWNQLDRAYTLIEEAISLCKQSKTLTSLMYIFLGYAVLIRICISCGYLEEARSVFQELERIGRIMNRPTYRYLHSFYTTVDQVRFWLACGELDRARCWAEEELDLEERGGTFFDHERQEVARSRIFLAMAKPLLALQRLEPVLERATKGKRWGHVIEILLLQALGHQMLEQEGQALDALSQAVRLAEPEGYIRSFIDEGVQIEALLYRLYERERQLGPTPYLDTLLTAFQQERKGSAQGEESIKMRVPAEPLTERELQVLQLLARGASNQQIAHELVIVIDTVKRHISHIFSKLGVKNRVQAVRQAQALGLLREED